MNFTAAAQANIDETGIDPQDDVDALQSGEHTRASLLAYCLDGADSDREQGWREYVDAICAAAALRHAPDTASETQDLVLLECMPEHLIELHRAANNFGFYPHNGAVRVIVHRDDAEYTTEDDYDGYDHIVRDATVADLTNYRRA